MLVCVYDRLCGPVVRVPGCKTRGPGVDSWHYQIFWVAVGLERGPLSFGRLNEELLKEKYRFRSRKLILTTMRHPSIHKSWHQISSTNGGRSVRSRTKGHGVCFVCACVYTLQFVSVTAPDDENSSMLLHATIQGTTMVAKATRNHCDMSFGFHSNPWFPLLVMCTRNFIWVFLLRHSFSTYRLLYSQWSICTPEEGLALRRVSCKILRIKGRGVEKVRKS
jgi:hypothetical protein